MESGCDEGHLRVTPRMAVQYRGDSGARRSLPTWARGLTWAKGPARRASRGGRSACPAHRVLGVLGGPVPAPRSRAARRLDGSAHPRPHLVSLDLGFNDLTDLQGMVGGLGSLRHLRLLVLQGNPLALVPYYRGLTVDSLARLCVLDDITVSPSEKHQFRGLSHSGGEGAAAHPPPCWAGCLRSSPGDTGPAWVQLTSRSEIYLVPVIGVWGWRGEGGQVHLGPLPHQASVAT